MPSEFEYVTVMAKEDFKTPAELVNPDYYNFLSECFQNSLQDKSIDHLDQALHLIQIELDKQYRTRSHRVLASVGYHVLMHRFVLLCERVALTMHMNLDFEKVSVSEGWTCAICFEGTPLNVVRFRHCHEFHQACLSNWLKTNPTCPLCRQSYFKIYDD